MTDYGIYTLKIDDEFKNLIPPLSSEERKQLEENIVQDGCREPISVWNKSILDGHNRYEICTRRQIPFRITYIFMKSREEAIAWICANQLGRRNITDEARRYLIGKRYEMSKIIGAHNAAGTNQYTRKEVKPKMLVEPDFDSTARSASERLGKEYRLSHATIDKYGIYAHAIDSLARIEPSLPPKILSGQVKISQSDLVEMARLSPTDIQQINTYVLQQSHDNLSFSDMRKLVPLKQKKSLQSSQPTSSGSVKDMPDYDPDVEILSLVFTIPSWISSIDRVRSSPSVKEVSGEVRRKLEGRLASLKSAIDAMIVLIGEEV